MLRSLAGKRVANRSVGQCLIALTLLLIACQAATGLEPSTIPTIQAAAAEPISAATVEAFEALAPLVERQTRVLSTALPSPIPSLTPSPSPSVTPTATNSPTPDPYADLTISALANRDYGGGLIDIVDTLEKNDAFTRYLISYPSDGLTIYGYMNVPNEGSKFPVALVLHGYIPPAQYQTVTYTERYANALAEAGFFVIHPSFRNYPPSDNGPDPYRIGYAIDVLNLIAIIRQQSQDPTGFLRRADADDINLWGHSMGGGVALRVITVNDEPYIRTAALYGSMSGDEALNYERIRQWSGGSSGDFELVAPPEALQAISPIHHLERIQAAVSIHHSDADDVVPPGWSDDLCQRLQALDHPTECFTYTGQPHTFRGYGDRVFIQRVIDFFNRY